MLATPALATDGYFSHGYGTHYKGIAGAGAALHLDSLAAATNGRRWRSSARAGTRASSLVSSDRYYTVSGSPSGFELGWSFGIRK